MRKLLLTVAVVSIGLTTLLYAQTSRSSQRDGAETGRGQAAGNPGPLEMVRLTSFYLYDGGLVSGRVIMEDKNGVTLDVLEEGKIKRKTYSYREVDVRTRTLQTMTDAEYYEFVARYFAGQTGDFENDPDDFIQAIRYYEKTLRQLKEKPEENAQKIADIREKIEDLHADREVWIRETQDRARLLELEDKATLNKRFEELHAENETLSQTLQTLQQEIKGLKEDMAFLNRDVDWQRRKLEEEAAGDPRQYRRDREYGLRYGYYPPYYYDYGTRYYNPGYLYYNERYNDSVPPDQGQGMPDRTDRPSSELNPPRPRPIPR